MSSLSGDSTQSFTRLFFNPIGSFNVKKTSLSWFYAVLSSKNSSLSTTRNKICTQGINKKGFEAPQKKSKRIRSTNFQCCWATRKKTKKKGLRNKPLIILIKYYREKKKQFESHTSHDSLSSIPYYGNDCSWTSTGIEQMSFRKQLIQCLSTLFYYLSSALCSIIRRKCRKKKSL